MTVPPPTSAPVITLNATSQTIILTGLKYFTDYTVEVSYNQERYHLQSDVIQSISYSLRFAFVRKERR